MMLAGADCVQVVSTLYLHQIEVLGSIISDIEKWMVEKGYDTIDSFRGKLSKNKVGRQDPVLPRSIY